MEVHYCSNFYTETSLFALSMLARSPSKIPTATVFCLQRFLPTHPVRQQRNSIFVSRGQAPALNSQEHGKCVEVGHEQGRYMW